MSEFSVIIEFFHYQVPYHLLRLLLPQELQHTSSHTSFMVLLMHIFLYIALLRDMALKLLSGMCPCVPIKEGNTSYSQAELKGRGNFVGTPFLAYTQ